MCCMHPVKLETTFAVLLVCYNKLKVLPAENTIHHSELEGPNVAEEKNYSVSGRKKCCSIGGVS